tara:strand:+ start:103145 stop:103300 length:156 start_codon:yes stop_codon:yes gene_type:complete
MKALLAATATDKVFLLNAIAVFILFPQSLTVSIRYCACADVALAVCLISNL